MNANARIRDEESCLQQPSSTQSPLGALIRYTDGSPKPPARSQRSSRPGSARTGRSPREEGTAEGLSNLDGSSLLTLHEGNFSSDGVILVTIIRSHSADSRLIFEVAEEPKPGQVRVLLDFGGNTELLHLAESVTAAELWIAREGYRNARGSRSSMPRAAMGQGAQT